MKNPLIKITLVAVLALSTHFAHGQNEAPLLNKSFAFSFAPMEALPKANSRYSRFLALHTAENLKAYHLGLKCLFPDHYIPNRADLIQTVRSHPWFCGVLSQQEGRDLFKESGSPCLIFEEKGGETTTPHFYIASEKGLRHFVVNPIQMGSRELGSIDNGAGAYANLNRILSCTLSFMGVAEIKLLKVAAVNSIDTCLG